MGTCGGKQLPVALALEHDSLSNIPKKRSQTTNQPLSENPKKQRRRHSTGTTQSQCKDSAVGISPPPPATNGMATMTEEEGSFVDVFLEQLKRQTSNGKELAFIKLRDDLTRMDRFQLRNVLRVNAPEEMTPKAVQS